MTDDTFLRAFETGHLAEEDFDHTAHVRAGFLLIRQLGFARAVPPYCAALQALTRRFGVPEKYHETITIAFLALISERLGDNPNIDWQGFQQNNPDIFQKDALKAYYSSAQLASPAARTMFQLPRPQ